MRVLVLMLVLTGSALAQQQSPADRATANKLLTDAYSILSCTTGLVTAQDKIAQLEAELAKLKEEKK